MQGGGPVNVKHGARRVVGKVGGDKKQRGEILMYYYKFAVIG